MAPSARARGITRLESMKSRTQVSVQITDTKPGPPSLHRQDDTEVRFAAQHAVVSLGGSFKRISFYHRTYAAQFSEVECVLRIGGGSRGPALNYQMTIGSTVAKSSPLSGPEQPESHGRAMQAAVRLSGHRDTGLSTASIRSFGSLGPLSGPRVAMSSV